MRVTIATVMSVDGRITQGDKVRPAFWRSAEDGVVLKGLIAHSQVLVMGRTTYETVRPRPSEGHLQVILTSEPEQFAKQSIPGSLEFVSLSPMELIANLKLRGYERVLLLGGSSNIPFLTAGLVHELYLTVEPSLFGAGQLLTENMPAAVPLQLIACKQLNKQGTLLLHYGVVRGVIGRATA